MRPSPDRRGHARRRRSAARGWPGWPRRRIPGRRRRSRCSARTAGHRGSRCGVDSPVAAGLALCEAVPVGVGGGSGRAAERDTRDAEDCARQRELRDGTTGIGGLAMASAHVGSVFLSVRTYEVSCRVRLKRSPGRVAPLGAPSASPRGPSRLRRPGPPGHRPAVGRSVPGRPVGPPFPVPCGSFVGTSGTTGQEFGAAVPDVEPGGSTGHDGNGSEGEVSPIDNAPIRVATDVCGADQGMKSQVVGSGYPKFRFEPCSLSARYVRKITCNSDGHPHERSPSPGASGRSGSSSGWRRRAGCR